MNATPNYAVHMTALHNKATKLKRLIAKLEPTPETATLLANYKTKLEAVLAEITRLELENEIAEQIGVLYSLHILKHRNKQDDPREDLIRKALETCTSVYQISIALHDIKVGNETIEDMLIRKGIL